MSQIAADWTPHSSPTRHCPTERLFDRMSRRAVHRLLSSLQVGQLTLIEQGQSITFGQPDPHDPELHATVQIQHPAAYRQLLTGGIIGAAEAFMDGHWSSPRLTELVRIVVRNRDLWTKLDRGFARIQAPFRKLWHWARRNTRTGSRRNISAHYDLGNDFFQYILDPTMMYSAAHFDRPGLTLQEASVTKLDRICRKLQLGPEDHLLEIGTGWGGFAIHAAQHYGCRITTTTISREQYQLARERIAAAGLSDRIELVQKDYRDLTGQYDKLVSIEMIEAVGAQWFDTYFATCSRLLKPNGAMLLQAITMNEQDYPHYLRSVDFIQKYIFPGGCLPSTGQILQSLAKKTDLKLIHLDDLAPHYAQTLACWRQNLHANLSRIQSLHTKYSDEFFRLWDFYFAYCEGAFLERSIGSVQMLLTKPRCPLPAPVTTAAMV